MERLVTTMPYLRPDFGIIAMKLSAIIDDNGNVVSDVLKTYNTTDREVSPEEFIKTIDYFGRMTPEIAKEMKKRIKKAGVKLK